MSLIEHAKKEFRAAGWTDDSGKFDDVMQEALCNHVLDLLKVFSDDGHSGTSAPYAINLFTRLAKFEPLVPLTGEDWEWNDTGHNFQNKRASHVFKDYDGTAYDIRGKVFWEWNTSVASGQPYKSYYTCGASHVPVTFPYTVPKEPEYVYRYSDATPPAPPQTEEGLL